MNVWLCFGCLASFLWMAQRSFNFVPPREGDIWYVRGSIALCHIQTQMTLTMNSTSAGKPFSCEER
jgi:hypothetical protein